jgi:ketosteroid isomerase-like protein
MNRADAIDLLDRLHAAQNRFYAGGSPEGLVAILAADIVWTVPGDNSIAGTYHGREQVLEYFRRRRDLAGGTFQMHRRDVLAGEGDRIAALVDGRATVGRIAREWSTVGLYDVVGEKIAACWLLALDQRAFDVIWTA